MDPRKVFDSVPKEFDKWRFRYCDELFLDIIKYSKLDGKKTVLEIGPGTGQATEPILKTGCSYLAIELGKNFTEFMKNKFGKYNNFEIINDDFETYNFETNKFDLVYSAATIQWIPEEIGFQKTYNILKSNGVLAMFMTHTDYRSSNETLYKEIQEIYKKYFHPEMPYTQHLEYRNAVKYGFIGFECHEYHKMAEFNSDDYVSLISIHSDHLTLKEPNKSKFFKGIKDAIIKHENKIKLDNKMILYLTKKP
jgi:ubiquinone/menaquinone biosynthesis C-methylase UbiE